MLYLPATQNLVNNEAKSTIIQIRIVNTVVTMNKPSNAYSFNRVLKLAEEANEPLNIRKTLLTKSLKIPMKKLLLVNLSAKNVQHYKKRNYCTLIFQISFKILRTT